MKKILISLGLFGILGGLIMLVSASNTSCRNIEFANGIDACIDLNNAGSNDRELSTNLDGGSESNLRCDIMTPDSILRSIPLCNGEFSYNGDEPGRIKLRIRYNDEAPEDWYGKPNSNSTWTYPQWVYDFDNEEWIDYVNNNYENLDSFTITLDDETPAEDDEVKLEIEAIDSHNDVMTDYEGHDAEVTIEYRTSPTSSRYDATSTQVTIDDETPNFEYGFAETDITFKESYEYRITVTDDNENVDDYETFQVGDYEGAEYSHTDNFYLTTYDTTPTANDRVSLTVTARDGNTKDTSYRGTILFEIYYKSPSASTWTKTTSANYYTMNDDEDYENDGHRFTTSDNGDWEEIYFIKFLKEDYQYKILVVDEDNNIEGEKIFTVGNTNNTSNSDTDNFSLTTDDSTPTTSQNVDLTVKARNGTATDTSYRGTVQFEVYYKASGSYTRVQTTSSTYYEMDADYEDDGYTFTSSNNGTKVFNNFIKFKKNNYSYKVVVYDEDDEDIEGYKIFTVGTVSNDSDVDGFTDSELRTLGAIYEARPDAINRLENRYPNLEDSSRRQSMADDIYDEMKLVLDDNNNREYKDFMDFYNAFLDRYRYTVSVR